MTQPGYGIIPLDVGKTTTTSNHWRFGWSRDHTHLSPLTVSKTLHALVRRVLKTHPDRWKILRFDMGADHSPVTGKPPPHFDR